MLAEMMQDFKQIHRFRYVILTYIETNLRLRYRRSVLGFVWTVLAPMLHYLVMGFVFSILMKDRMENYFTFYFSGALFFSIITATLGRAPGVFLVNENFIKKIAVPKMVFVLNGIIYEGINFLLSATALIVLGLLTSHLNLSWHIILSIVPVILILLFLIGLGAAISVATVYFRDLAHIIPVILQAAFFVTPVIYQESMIPDQYHAFVKFNPLYYFLELFRVPLLAHEIPPLSYYGIAAGLGLVFFVFGFWIVKKFDNKLIFKL